jgi:hypothetical protein
LILSVALDKLFASKVENAVVEIPYLCQKEATVASQETAIRAYAHSIRLWLVSAQNVWLTFLQQ